MYDAMSSDYDRFVNWDNRLQAEMPFLLNRLSQIHPEQDPGAVQVVDAACGTGQHAIALAKNGYSLVGADFSRGMIAQARSNAQAAGQVIRFEQAGFGEITAVFGQEMFGALLCLGNSLPHAVAEPDLNLALADFAAALHPGGLLLIQNRNFDLVMAQRARWMEPQSHREGDREWLFLRFYDFEPDGTIVFHVITLKRMSNDPWEQQVASTRLRPLLARDLAARLAAAGFTQVESFGSMAGEPFDPASSGNLVISARRL
jgi:glycine/sarcosine N-methyltransferase